jgi:hypothetical protein
MRNHIRWAIAVALLGVGSTAANAEPHDAAKCSFVQEEVMLALSDPPKGRTKEYNDFFGKVHIPEVVSRGIGFLGAQRFHVLASIGSTPWNYVSVYGLERGNQVAQTGVKFRPGAAPPTMPGPYLAEGSAAWIFRRSAATGDDTGGTVACPHGQKVFMVLPKTPGLDLKKALGSVPGLVSAERYEFKAATKGARPAAQEIAIFRSTADVNVTAALARLGSLVGCQSGKCTESAGAVWALEPQADFVARSDVSETH